MGKNYYLKDRDILDQALEHSWGKSAEAKAKEKAYNREYYQRHKEEILRKARQAGEGIQRTAHNAANAIDREARAISDTIMRPNYERRIPELSTWRYDYPDTGFHGQGIKNSWALERDKEDRNRTRDALKFPTAERNRARNEQRAYNAERQLRKSANWRSANAAARNERSKKANTLMPESRFDSKLIRDAQNAYSKVRGNARTAKINAENAFNNARSAAEDAYNKAQTRKDQRRRAKGYDMMSKFTAAPSKIVNKYGDMSKSMSNPEFRESASRLANYSRQYGAAANEAAKASMTRAQKEALKKREEAKRRMKKWFNR